MTIFMYSSETMLQGEEERSETTRDVQIENLRGLVGIRRIDRTPNTRERVVRSEGRCGKCSLVIRTN